MFGYYNLTPIILLSSWKFQTALSKMAVRYTLKYNSSIQYCVAMFGYYNLTPIILLSSWKFQTALSKMAVRYTLTLPS